MDCIIDLNNFFLFISCVYEGCVVGEKSPKLCLQSHWMTPLRKIAIFQIFFGTCVLYLLHLYRIAHVLILYPLVLGPSRSSAWLCFGSSFWAKKLSSACHAFQKAWLGLPYLAKKARFGSACSMIEKTKLPQKQKKSADFQHFWQFFKV